MAKSNSSKVSKSSKAIQAQVSDFEFLSDDEQIEINGVGEKSSHGTSSHSLNLSKEQIIQNDISSKKGRSVLYVGNLPQTFQQYELKKYFGQFGDITRVRLLKIKKTGKSRGYGFVEYKDSISAKAAVESMDNYLLGKSNLKVQILENHADNLFSAKMKSKFGEFDWRLKEHNEYNAAKPLETWLELQAQFEESKKAKVQQLRDAGFNYNLKV